MKFLTQQERWALGLVISLLLVGWAIKNYRAAHPTAPQALTAEP